MVKATNVDMSLDDIISKTRKNRSSIGKRPVGGNRGRAGGNGGGRNFRTAPRPNAGWRDFDSPSHRDNGFSSGGGNKTVRVNLSNLAPSVIASDLDELFGNFGIDTSVVNYNEHGESLGTGDITLKKRDAERLIKQFVGVALDGKVMKFAIVDTSSMSGRVDFGNRRPPVGRTTRGGRDGGRKFVKSKPEDFLRDGVHEGDTRRGGRPGRGGRQTKRGGREEKVKKTDAELDAELEAYMSKRKA